MLDETAWAFNIRGEDIPHCPVVLSYAVMGHSDAGFNVDGANVPTGVRDALERDGVSIRPHDSVLQNLEGFSERDLRVWIDPASTSLALAKATVENAL